MKINHGYQDSRAIAAPESSKTQETAAAGQVRSDRAAAGASRTGGTDQVNLSSLASVLQGALSDSPERAAYLERLASEYEAGTYAPDPNSIASGIVSDPLSESPSSTEKP